MRWETHLSSGKINLGGGGNDISLVDTSQWDTVDLVGTGDQQETRLKSLDANNTLTTETTSEKDKDSSGGDAAANGSSLSGLARLLGLGNILSGVEAAGLVGRDSTLLTTLKFNSLVSRGRLVRSLDSRLGVLVQCLLGIDSRATNGKGRKHGQYGVITVEE
jgi:hypothetical protein